MKVTSILFSVCISALVGGSFADQDLVGREALGRPRFHLPPHHPPAHHTVKKSHKPTAAAAHSDAVRGHGSQNAHKTAHHSKHSTDHSDKGVSTHHKATSVASHSTHTTHTKSTSHSPSHTGGPTKNMIIFGRPGTSDATFNKAIKDVRHKVKVLVQEKKLNLQMASVPLTKSEITKLKKNRVIADIEEDVEGYDPDTGRKEHSTNPKGTKGTSGGKKKSSPHVKRDYMIQQNVPDLGLISQEPGYGNHGEYYYHESAGEGSTIYMIDSGLNMQHKEFKTLGKIRWLFPNSEITNELKEDPTGHGTCVAAKAVGSKYGVAKKAKLIVVKSAEYRGFSAMIAEWSHIFADASITNVDRAVINYSSVIYSQPGQYGLKRLKDILQKILDLGLVIVTTAGNDHGLPVNTYPALFASSMPIIVVGAVDSYGHKASYSQTGFEVALSAVGRVECPTSRGPSGARFDQGTSFAAPQIAGLAAYLLAHPDSTHHFAERHGVAKSREMLQVLRAMAYPRVEGGPRVAYNGVGGKIKCNLSPPDSECPAYDDIFGEPSLIQEHAAAATTLATKTKGAEHSTAAHTTEARGGAATHTGSSNSKNGDGDCEEDSSGMCVVQRKRRAAAPRATAA